MFQLSVIRVLYDQRYRSQRAMNRHLRALLGYRAHRLFYQERQPLLHCTSEHYHRYLIDTKPSR